MFTKQWLKCAIVRAIKTMAQSFIAMIGTSVVLIDVEWIGDGIEYKTGDRFIYEDKFYKVLQDHTSQADWLPNNAT